AALTDTGVGRDLGGTALGRERVDLRAELAVALDAVDLDLDASIPEEQQRGPDLDREVGPVRRVDGGVLCVGGSEGPVRGGGEGLSTLRHEGARRGRRGRVVRIEAEHAVQVVVEL